jgi:GTPase SAR1 family protein
LYCCPYYLRSNLQGIALPFSLISQKTFDRAKEWFAELQRNCTTATVLYLVGCKLDLQGNREVETKEGQQFAQEHKCEFTEVSAKTGLNITELFENLAKLLWTRTKG